MAGHPPRARQGEEGVAGRARGAAHHLVADDGDQAGREGVRRIVVNRRRSGDRRGVLKLVPSAVRCRAALVLAVVALLAGACGSGSKPAAAEPPATVLARITSFVKAHRTARFTATEYAGGGD